MTAKKAVVADVPPIAEQVTEASAEAAAPETEPTDSQGEVVASGDASSDPTPAGPEATEPAAEVEAVAEETPASTEPSDEEPTVADEALPEPVIDPNIGSGYTPADVEADLTPEPFDGNVHEEAPGSYAAWTDTTPAALAAALTAEPQEGFVRVAFDHYVNMIGLSRDRIAHVHDGIALVAEADVPELLALGGRVA